MALNGINLVDDLRINRVVGVDEFKKGGVIMLRNEKAKVRSTTLHAELQVKADDPVKYVLLTDHVKGNVISNAANITMWIFLLIFVIKLDLADPFAAGSLKRAGRAGLCYMISLLAAMLGELYTRVWFGGFNDHGPGFHYPDSFYFTSFVYQMALVMAILSLYTRGVQIQREHDLTI